MSYANSVNPDQMPHSVVSDLGLLCPLVSCFNPTALRKAKIVCNFGLSECNRVTGHLALMI